MFGRFTFWLSVIIVLYVAAFSLSTKAQQPNPVDRQVTNPITDKPELNPPRNDPITTPRPGNQSLNEVIIDAANQSTTGVEGKRVSVAEGDVIVKIGTYRLQADKISYYEETSMVIAEGNVILDYANSRVTASRAEWNARTKLGKFYNSTGFTDQTDDGTVLYFTAEQVERISLNTYIVINAEVTACDEAVPKWSFRTSKATIKVGDRLIIKGTTFRIRTIPVAFLPFASISLKKQDRQSGFLIPTVSSSGAKGVRISNAYYLTLGRSADITFRGDLYTQRGIGFGLDLRTVANSRSHFNLGFYTVKDRIFGSKASDNNPDQGGSSFYAEGVHYFNNGFIAVADINITSNLAFRQVFSDGIQQVISPEERSQIYINKNYNDYSFNFLTKTQVTSIPNVRVRTRLLPSINFEKRPSPLSFLKKFPVYFSYSAQLDGVSRKETAEDIVRYRQEVGGDPIITPSLVQRFDFHPQVSVPFTFKGWSLTLTGGLRGTYYSNSLNPTNRAVTSRDLFRGYSEFEFDARPPSLARNFYKGEKFFFRHVIEPYITYRKTTGISNFQRLIQYDYLDTIAATNEIEFGVTNRFFTRRSTQQVANVSGEPAADELQTPNTLSSQPYEALSVTLRMKYFFDPTFGGALTPGRRNQFYPITTLSGFTFGGIPRRFSPIALEVRYRPSRTLTADFRTDIDPKSGGLRNISATFGLQQQLIQAFTTFYYTRAIQLFGNLSQYNDPRGFEAGTLRGSQWSPSIFIGRTERGLFLGASLFFDFQNRRFTRNSPLISSTFTGGYAWDCCAVVVQYRSYNVGLRNENRVLFGFRLKGIGSFGTESFGERF
jgi:LPS-assembly protein